MGKRKRNIPLFFWVTEDEKALIEQKMREHGVSNMSAFLRKMAIDGYSIRLDFPELRELVSLMRRSSNNMNQVAKRVNATGRMYEADIDGIRAFQEQEWDAIQTILTSLAKIRCCRILAELHGFMYHSGRKIRR